MLFDQLIPSKSMYISHIRVMLMDYIDFSTYVVNRFPYQYNDLTDVKCLYPSLVMEIDHMRMPIKTGKEKCVVLNALTAYWPSNELSQVAVIEFRSIQRAMAIEPDITQCKKLLLGLIKDKWGVRFKGKELIVC